MLITGFGNDFEDLESVKETFAGGVVATVVLKDGSRFKIAVERL